MLGNTKRQRGEVRLFINVHKAPYCAQKDASQRGRFILPNV